MKKNKKLLARKFRKYVWLFLIICISCIWKSKGGMALSFPAAQKQKIALTFDDGPCCTCTVRLLDGLKERGVHATFFLIGKNIDGKEEIVQRMQQEGHLIGNHTYDHVQLNKIPVEKARLEIEKTNNKIFEITGVYPCFIRPPYGAWPKNLDLTVEMFPVMWNVDTLDWKNRNVAEIREIVRKQVSDGAILLLHDIFPTSVDAALEIVDELTEAGFEFVTVDEFLLV